MPKMPQFEGNYPEYLNKLKQVGLIPKLTPEEMPDLVEKARRVEQSGKKLKEAYGRISEVQRQIKLLKGKQRTPTPKGRTFRSFKDIGELKKGMPITAYYDELDELHNEVSKHMIPFRDGISSKEKLIFGHLPLMFGIAKKVYNLVGKKKGVDLMDLTQEANLALLETIESFSAKKGEAFVDVARKNASRRINALIKSGTPQAPFYLKRELESALGSLYTIKRGNNSNNEREAKLFDDEALEEAQRKVNRIRTAIAFQTKLASLEDQVNDGNKVVGDYVSDAYSLNRVLAQTESNFELQQKLESALDTLEKGERKLIRGVFLGNSQVMDLEDRLRFVPYDERELLASAINKLKAQLGVKPKEAEHPDERYRFLAQHNMQGHFSELRGESLENITRVINLLKEHGKLDYFRPLYLGHTDQRILSFIRTRKKK